MKKIIALLDGGLGNKLNGLFQAIHVSQILNAELEITNIRNNYGDFNLKNLLNFDFSYKDYDSHTEFDRSIDPKIPIFLHSKFFNYNRDIFDFNGAEQSNFDKFIILTDKINFDNSYLDTYIKLFSINKDILSMVNDFIKKNKIEENTIGLHIRGTDFQLRSQNIERAEKIINENKNNKIFVCTDEKELNEIYKKMSNVIIYEKNNFVKKFNDNLNWNGEILDVDKRKWNYNVYRNESVVKDSFIEMLILSETRMYGSGRSTFYTWAERIKKTKFLKENLLNI